MEYHINIARRYGMAYRHFALMVLPTGAHTAEALTTLRETKEAFNCYKSKEYECTLYELNTSRKEVTG